MSRHGLVMGPRRAFGVSIRLKVLVMNKILRDFLADDTGATAVEYSLIASLIAVTMIVTLSTVGRNLNARFALLSNGFS